jgi:chemotaxis protein MotB
MTTSAPAPPSSSPPSSSPPRIVRRKARVHDDHHGGAWKVAYADLVTAMMAFFLVMWLISQGQDVKESVAAYFSDPVGFASKAAAGSGMMPGSPELKEESAPPAEGDVEAQLRRKALEIQQAIEALPEFDDLADQIVVTVGPEGIRIQLLEAEESSFFSLGKADLSQQGTRALQTIARVIAPIEYPLALEGHTDSKPYLGTAGYTNWELSADRANAARRVLSESGVDPARLDAIRGYADTRLRFPENPLDARNRRIEILVLNPALAHEG